MKNTDTLALSFFTALLIVTLTYLLYQTLTIKKGFAELEYKNLLIKNQIKCAEKALDIPTEVTKQGCVKSSKDLRELENLNCSKKSI